MMLFVLIQKSAQRLSVANTKAPALKPSIVKKPVLKSDYDISDDDSDDSEEAEVLSKPQGNGRKQVPKVKASFATLMDDEEESLEESSEEEEVCVVNVIIVDIRDFHLFKH